MSRYNIKTLKEKQAIMDCLLKHGWKETLKKYDVPRATLVHWKERVQSGNKVDLALLQRKVKRRTIRPETAALVKKLHAENPSYSLDQIREKVLKTQKISRTKIWHILHDEKDVIFQ